LGLLDIISYVDKITFETRRKPPMPSPVIVEEKNSNWMALGLYSAET